MSSSNTQKKATQPAKSQTKKPVSKSDTKPRHLAAFSSSDDEPPKRKQPVPSNISEKVILRHRKPRTHSPSSSSTEDDIVVRKKPINEVSRNTKPLLEDEIPLTERLKNENSILKEEKRKLKEDAEYWKVMCERAGSIMANKQKAVEDKEERINLINWEGHSRHIVVVLNEYAERIRLETKFYYEGGESYELSIRNRNIKMKNMEIMESNARNPIKREEENTWNQLVRTSQNEYSKIITTRCLADSDEEKVETTTQTQKEDKRHETYKESEERYMRMSARMDRERELRKMKKNPEKLNADEREEMAKGIERDVLEEKEERGRNKIIWDGWVKETRAIMDHMDALNFPRKRKPKPVIREKKRRRGEVGGVWDSDELEFVECELMDGEGWYGNECD